MNYLFKILLTVNSIIMLVLIYFIKSNILLIPSKMFLSLIIYFFIPIIIAIFVLILCKQLPKDSMEKGSIKRIEQADITFLPVYLGYFFVALSIPEGQISLLVFISLMLFAFLIRSQNVYYNPWLLMFGYRFYNIDNLRGMKVLVITKKIIYNAEKVEFEELRRINDYVFIDMEGTK